MNSGLRDLARQHTEMALRMLAKIARSGLASVAQTACRNLDARGLPFLAWLRDDEDLAEFLDRVARGDRIDGMMPTARQRLNAMIWATRLRGVRAVAGPRKSERTEAR